MKQLINVMKNRMFWLGFQTCYLIVIISNFIEGKESWQYTIAWGVITFIFIGLDSFFHEKTKELEDEE